MRIVFLIVGSALDLIGLTLDILIDALDSMRCRTDSTNGAIWNRYIAHKGDR